MTALSVYYGAPAPGVLEVLAAHHTVIVQTILYTPRQLGRLRRSAT